MPQYEELDGVRYLIVHDVEDVTDQMLEMAEEIYDGWFSDEDRIDWQDFIDRLARWGNNADPQPFDFNEYDTPAERKIKRHIRDYKNG